MAQASSLQPRQAPFWAEITACAAIDPSLLYQEDNYEGKGELWRGESLPLLHLVLSTLDDGYVMKWKHWNQQKTCFYQKHERATDIIAELFGISDTI